MVPTVTNQSKQKCVVAAIGRWMPPHIGHKSFLIELTKHFEKVLVLIGSCYEIGTERNCITAIEREKMIRAMFKREKVSEKNYEIAHVPDTETFDEWIMNIEEVCKMYGVTHFCTGNKEDILNVLEKRGEKLSFEMINPEDDSACTIHATDIRKFIIEGNYEELSKYIPDEIKPILFQKPFKEILACSRNAGISIVPGRQTVDLVFLIRNIRDGQIYVLLGTRSNHKVDFPGFLSLPGGEIKKFESPISAAIREFGNKTGLKVNMLDNSLEPAIVNFENVPNFNIEQMHFIGIYSSRNLHVAGTRGGSSQCFGIFVEDDLYKYEEYLVPNEDFSELKFWKIKDIKGTPLAYQHQEMLEKAVSVLEATI